MAKKRKRAKRVGRPKGRGGVNKSQAIRDYLAKSPDTPPRQIAAELGERGIKVSAMFVSAIKSKSRTAKGSTTRRGRRGGAAQGSSIDHLLAAKRFATSVGGVAAARRALDTLAEVMK